MALNESDLCADPMAQFRLWFAEWRKHAGDAEGEFNAVTLATADANGKPSARIVLLKEVDAGGFVFYTNYQSRKGAELAANPNAALTFWWPAMERQVRAEGVVAKVAAAQSDAYFHSRPRKSQLGAAASQQSETLTHYAALTDEIARLDKNHPQKIPRPQHWGGYRLTPKRMEFWQSRANRLHDRVCYCRVGGEGEWSRGRLWP